ncbi:alpha/beta fold hydrolase [Amorphoplanes nipponensis]|uniref:Triacylglycerol lipase n=1 Tax=Actinoplanes nipponensis TaxID=135950 RepID=A0A919JMA2_9ACTN|nr:alpha/beta fold hydrolase [Actinoplanes nipponensis]GIE51781.1 triacylglycerol lipase [Actinoplanes nipponensis]
MNSARFHALVAAFQVALLSTAILFFAGSPAKAAVAPGTVLLSVTATLPAELGSLGTAKRIAYVSTSATGSTITATGLIITPRTNKKNRTVVWGHGTTGLADKCAPSANQAVFWPEARAAIAALLAKGWTVAAPDYPGLGTPSAHPYLIGLSEARSMIDSVKAARNLDSKLTTAYAVDGHSQGGQGALFAGQLAPSYDGALVLKGVAAIAPVSNADIFAPLIPGTPGQGYLVMALYGLNAVDPAFNPASVLAAPAQQRTTVLQSGCLYEILDAYAGLTAEELLVGGALPDPVLAELASHDNPAQTAPSAPVLLVQGTDDEAVPYFLTADVLLGQLRAYPTATVDFVAVSGANHDGAVFATTTQVADWIAARFA